MTRYPKAGKGNPWTVRELKAIAPEWKGDTLSDGGGLFGDVRLSKTGEVSVRFRYVFWWEGKARWHQCGTWPAVDLAQIRRERDSARQKVAEGVNPALAKKAAKIKTKEAMEATIAKAKRDKVENLTVADLAQAWLKDGVSRADGNAELQRYFGKDVLPAIGSIPLRRLSDSDLLGMLGKIKERIRTRRIGKSGNTTVALLATEVRQMLGWAEKRQPWRTLLIEGNPADLVNVKVLLDPDYQKQRDRVLSADEIGTLYSGLLPLAEYRSSGVQIPRMRFAIPICLSTLCRIGELVQAKWEHIDWQAGTWHIPAGNTKGKRGSRQAQLVFLSPFALRQFRGLQADTGSSTYCFPNRKGTGFMKQKTASQLIDCHQKEGGYYPVLPGGHWTLHDMRRTGATLMQSLGVPLEIIDRCQNHVLAGSAVRRHYMHYSYAKEKAEAWHKLGAYLDDLAQGA